MNSLLREGRPQVDVQLEDLLTPSSICFLESTSRNEVLESLVDLSFNLGLVPSRDNFFNAIMAREKLLSTGIGIQVAFPHARLEEIDQFFVCIGVLQHALDWEAIDHQPVRLVYLVGGPANRQTMYLHILSKLTLTLKNDETRLRMMQSQSLDEIYNIVTTS